MPESQRHHARTLAGASVIVTRPAADAAALIRAANSRGAVAVRLPGTRIRIIDDTVAARRALIAAKSASFWIFTSPNAVRYCRQLLGEVPAAKWPRALAVGAGTRQALARYGIDALTPLGAQNSEGLLAEPALADLQGKFIAIVDAPGGRDLLAPALRERGARVERIAVYQRLPPRLNTRHFSNLAAAPRPWISLVSSSVILNHLCAALPTDLQARWRREALIVSSARLAAEAEALGFTDVHEARSALGADLLDAAERALSRHRI
ncbi:MAG: uroporphyrinogen-III synthase [Xanthomonadales bacterium]|nr:uroporphyrinogen-III synthase [Xanthomonadales bacterium]